MNRLPHVALALLLFTLISQAQAGPSELPNIDSERGQNMVYGPAFCHSIAFGPIKNKNQAIQEDTTARGLVVRLPGDAAICYDMDRLTVSGVWTGGFVGTQKTHHTSYKGGSPAQAGGDIRYKDLATPGWLDGQAKPIAREGLHLRGYHLHGPHVVLTYDVGQSDKRAVNEMPAAHAEGDVVAFGRAFTVGSSKESVELLVGRLDGAKATTQGTQATFEADKQAIAAAVVGRDAGGLTLRSDEQGAVWLRVPSAKDSRLFTVWSAYGPRDLLPALKTAVAAAPTDIDPSPFATKPGPARWNQAVVTQGALGKDMGGYAADDITVPYKNPWGCWMRTSAIDFFEDGAAAVGTINGDVWLVNWNDDLSKITWRRFASGLYEPLGLKVVDGKVYVRGRDRITRLHDHNGDQEADFYENFHSDGPIGTCYHAFIFDLVTDTAGNFYFTTSGRKAPTVGEVVRVSPDGREREVIATDFRHPNGLGFGGPHGWLTVADNPSGRAVYNGAAVVQKGGTYGHTKGRSVPMLYTLPPALDSSSGSQCWSDPKRWGPLSGSMLHTSYSKSVCFYVMTQDAKPHPNGFAVKLPFRFKSGSMRAAVNPQDGQMVVAGQKGWDSNAVMEGCLYRIRYTGGPTYMVTSAAAVKDGIRLTFSCDLDPDVVDAEGFSAQRGGASKKGALKDLKITSAKLVDQRTVMLTIPDLAPSTEPIAITFDLDAKDGKPVYNTIYATINGF